MDFTLGKNKNSWMKKETRMTNKLDDNLSTASIFFVGSVSKNMYVSLIELAIKLLSDTNRSKKEM